MVSVLIFALLTLDDMLVLVPIFLIYVIWNLNRCRKLIPKLRAAGLGKEGEEYTGQELNFLMRKGAYVFHDIPYRYGNIDHIVVGLDKVLVVETKTYRKPQSKKGGSSREYKVRYDGDSLHFPTFVTGAPLEQAQTHAKFVRSSIKRHCGFDFPVLPIVALPGWFVVNDKAKSEKTLVVNPKRSRALVKWLGELKDPSRRDKVAVYLESVARSVSPISEKTDPDAGKKYDFWLNPKIQEKELGGN